MVAPLPPPLPPLVTSELSEKGVLVLTLNRGSKRNALSLAVIDALIAELLPLQQPEQQELTYSDSRWHPSEVRVIVLQGNGPAFSSGHDLKELSRLQASKDEAAILTLFTRCGIMTKLLRNTAVPVVAAVHGAAHAAGCEVVAACDLVVADQEHASFATPGVKIGLFCHTPAVSVVRALGGGAGGARKAAKMLYTGQAISASEAFRLGLVHELAPPGRAKTVALKLASTIAAASPFVVRQGKATLRLTSDEEMPCDGTKHQIAAAAMATGLLHGDCEEGIAAFFEKRPPKWAPVTDLVD
jgi:enoyl-CoA hydratase/carnithine racemase